MFAKQYNLKKSSKSNSPLKNAAEIDYEVDEDFDGVEDFSDFEKIIREKFDELISDNKMLKEKLEHITTSNKSKEFELHKANHELAEISDETKKL
jgi:hypothetical protein